MLDELFLQKRIQEITLHIYTYNKDLEESKAKIAQLENHLIKLNGHLCEAQNLLNEMNSKKEKEWIDANEIESPA